MDIKKVDGKPMVLHTKEKPKLKVKGAPETKIKGRNALTAQHGTEVAGATAENGKTNLKGKTNQAQTAVCGTEYRGNSVQDRRSAVQRKNVDVNSTGGTEKRAAYGKDALTVQCTPKIAESAVGNRKIKPEKNSVYVADKRKASPAKTYSDGMGYRESIREGGGRIGVAQRRNADINFQGRQEDRTAHVRNAYTVYRSPKLAGLEAKRKIKLKKFYVHVADKRKASQSQTSADSMGCRDNAMRDTGWKGAAQHRNAGTNSHGSPENGTAHVRNAYTVYRSPKLAGLEAKRKIKLKKFYVHVANKRKASQSQTSADNMECRNNAMRDTGWDGAAQHKCAGTNSHGNPKNEAAQGKNAFAVQRSLKIAGFAKENGKIKLKKNSYGAVGKEKLNQTKEPVGGMGCRGNAVQDGGWKGSAQHRKADTDQQGKPGDGKAYGRREKGQNARQSLNQEGYMGTEQAGTTPCHKEKAEKETARPKKHMVSAAVVSVASKSAIDEMEGAGEAYEAYMVADALAQPAKKAVGVGKDLLRPQAAKAKGQKVKKKDPGSHIKGKAVKESAVNAARKTAQTAVKERVKEASKAVPGGILAGMASGENAGAAIDKRGVKNSARNRMVKLFVTKQHQEKKQGTIGKALKDIVLMRFSKMAKYLMHYVGLSLLALVAVVAAIALPVIAVLAIIYNSPLAVFFPSISSGETVQEVLSAYVEEFNREVNEQLNNHIGYGTSEKVYVNFEGTGTPDNFYDILMAYMVKHGDGDTATDMTDKAKQNLKSVFDDMCSYTIARRMDIDTDGEGNIATTAVKEVRVELKSCYDMVSAYGFNEKKQEMLAELMNPEYLAMIGYTGGGEDDAPGEGLSPEQYQAVVDAISDENGRQVVAFALSKVGYPYSQAYRDSGDYYDCSSLAYYAWHSAGVNIMYEGSNTAASEGKFCYDNNLLVNYDEMQPGDLIFYSYDRNGRFMDITHVAVYVGDGKVVEAANTSLGVVYRSVQGRSSIVFIGRPR